MEILLNLLKFACLVPLQVPTIYSRLKDRFTSTVLHMESETVKPPKALPNTLRKVMPTVVVATKLSQGKKDLGNPKYIRSYWIVSRTHAHSL